MLRVGLTGGIGSGKTAVAKVLNEEGAYLIDADQIARELVQPHKPAWKELVRVFGKEILTGNGLIHRKKLAAQVFSNEEKRNLLNQILHPRILKEMKRRAEEIRRKDTEAIVVVDAALLVETGAYREMDKVIVVASTEAQQVERVKKREGASEEDTRRIVAAQMTLGEKLQAADFVIQNEGSLEETKMKAREVFQELRKIVLKKRKERKPS